ncbi:MAG: type II toxin-antitoxin system RelE/ParE family toxin [Syntrophales bacterium]|nr:type II toxin-antitoxin system RelE/ParE family toxin [Syntrophales bacterium]
MIQDFKHKGLKKLFEASISSGVKQEHVARLRRILALLETAETLDDMDLPGLRLHELKGKRKGTWSVQVTGNWRVTFKLQKGDVFEVNYEDYH